jgi:hypothetical protein
MVWKLNAPVKALLQEIAEIKELLSVSNGTQPYLAYNRESTGARASAIACAPPSSDTLAYSFFACQTS